VRVSRSANIIDVHILILAERVGFEPTVRITVRLISSRTCTRSVTIPTGGNAAPSVRTTSDWRTFGQYSPHHYPAFFWAPILAIALASDSVFR